MKKLIVNAVVGVLLFVGSLVGGLAATGRLNHEGVANIPLLSMLFSEPPKEEHADGEHAAGDPAAAEAAANGQHAAPGGETADAAHKASDGTGPADAAAGGAGPQEPERPHKKLTGKSLFEQPKEAGGGHGGGGGEGGHGEGGATEGNGEKAGHGDGDKKETAGHGKEPTGAGDTKGEHSAERDFSAQEIALAAEKVNKYAPGGYFTFQGMPAGMTPEELNTAWQRVQGVLAELEQRKAALDQRERELGELVADIDNRQRALGKKADEITAQQKELEERIRQFKEQVKLVRSDEVAGLRRNAQTFESFEPKKSAELVKAQWATPEGQAEILKTFEFMNKDKVNEIIQELDNALIKDVLKMRLLVSKEAAPTAGGRK